MANRMNSQQSREAFAILRVAKKSGKRTWDGNTMVSVGTHIGQYKIKDTIGEGGMGTVYLAQDPSNDTVVAIKILRNDIPSEEIGRASCRERV
jgi:serine/threonine protein kinase